ncbi:MAG: ABC transporter permease [Trueperaceae bacterium]
MTTGTYPTGTPAASTAAKEAPRPNLARVLWVESKTEFVKLLRLPAYSVATLAFPLMFYLVFGAAYGRFEAQGIDMPTYLLATFGAGGVLSAALFSFGAGVASERAQGWMLLKRVSPMPPVAYFFAKTVMALAFGVLVIVLITLLGMLTQGVRIEALAWLRMLGTLLTGVFPFAALGLAFGYLFGPNSAPVVLNLIYTPMAFASGLWIPISTLPDFVQKAAPFLPSYHFAQLALGTVGAAPRGDALWHVLVLAISTAVFLSIAVWAYRRDEGRTYG